MNRMNMTSCFAVMFGIYTVMMYSMGGGKMLPPPVVQRCQTNNNMKQNRTAAISMSSHFHF